MSTVEEYVSGLPSSLFERLPKEIIMEIISFMVGDFNVWFYSVDVSSIKRREETIDNPNKIHDHLTVYIPSIENIKSLIQFSTINKRINILVCADEEFERFWLRGLSFHGKLMYWIRTTCLDSMDLCRGDLNSTEMDEMIRIQDLIQTFERGKPSTTNYDVVLSTIENPLDMDVYRDEDLCRNILISRMNQFNISFEDYEMYFKSKGSSAFDMFLTHSLTLSLDMYKHMDAENDTEYWDDHREVLLSSEYIEHWPEKSTSYVSNIKSVLGMKKSRGKHFGVTIESPTGWKEFVMNNIEIQEKTQTQNSMIEDKTQISDGWIYGAGLVFFLLSYWSLYIILALPLLLLIQGRWLKALSGYITVDNENRTSASIDINNDLTKEPEFDEQGTLKEKLSNSIYLNLVNILFLDPLKDFVFPKSIRFLSIDYNSTNAYCTFPKYRWNSFFNGCTFPGVKYLRIRFSEKEHSLTLKTVMKPETTSGILLESILSPHMLPNLEYLVLSGFDQTDYLMKHLDYLKQLHGIEIVFDYNSRDKGWSAMNEFTSKLSKISNNLKYVIIETDIDPRYQFSHKAIKKFYDSHKCTSSIGTVSIQVLL